MEIALGPKVAFENGNIGIVKRRVALNGVVNALPRSVVKLKPPKTPRVTELLRKAMEWKELLDAGEVPTLVEIARREGLSRARITQIMSLLRLAPDIRNYILSMPRVTKRPVVTERLLRPIVRVENLLVQAERFQQLLRHRGKTSNLYPM
ncbi:MAG: hypothetical protein HY889_01600 [Deltaproteobacteria bacterium]|nr:hypothetical protein [Deltaproteobacteria bacterium]